MTAWTLGIDFGTTYTVGAVANQTGTVLVDVEGDGSCRMPSAVLLSDDLGFAVGQAAIHQALFRPDRFEPTPKRSIGDGEVWLGDEPRPVIDVIAAVLDRVGTEARNVAGSPPGRTVLTHPAEWGAVRLEVLRAAADSAGLGAVELVPEPVAAALEIGTATLSPGDHVAVYDFGGGTFDVAVLRRTKEGFEVAGPPGGRDPLGGEQIDNRIIEHLGSGPLGEHPDWPKLMSPPDLEWRRHAAALRAEVRKAKEGLSNQTVWQLWIPGLSRDVQLSRSELEELIRDDVSATIRILVDTVRNAGVEPENLRGVYLVGGSSRIPAVFAQVWNELGVEPSVRGDPKTVVAQGATRWWPPPAAKPPTASSETGPPFGSRLAVATRTVFWTSPVFCYGYRTIKAADDGQITISDEPAPGPLADTVKAATSLWESTPGYEAIGTDEMSWLGAPAVERRFGLLEPTRGQWVERCTVIAGRAVKALAPAHLAHRLDTITRIRSVLDRTRFYQMEYSLPLAEGDRIHERLELIRSRTNHRVTAESYELDAEWARSRVEAFSSHPGYTSLNRSSTRLLGSPQKSWALGLSDGVPGEMHTFWVSEGRRPCQTRLWTGQAGGRSYIVTTTLPENEKLGFRPLLAHATLIGGANSGRP